MNTVLLVLAVLAAAIAAGFVLLRARRAGLALHRQLDDLRNAIGAARARTAEESPALRQGVEALRQAMENVSTQVAQVQTDLGSTNSLLGQVQGGVREISAQATVLAARVDALNAIAETIARRPPQILPIDPRLVSESNREELLARAESIAILRPLVPYPNWRTDADYHNRDASYQLRLWFWQYFSARKQDAPVVVAWHGGTRLRLFLGDAISSQVYVAGCIEPNEFAFFDRVLQPGMIFLDIGANEGTYTVFAARRVGPSGAVWAFEPSRRELERLDYNLRINQLGVSVFPVALADTTGEAELLVGGRQYEGQNTLGAFAYQGVELAYKERVNVRRLDDVVAQDPPARIDVIKLDVEGSEIRVLRGAAATLDRYRPLLLFEVSEDSLKHQGGSREALLDAVRSHRYRLYQFDFATGLPTPAVPGVFTDNMIGVPEERALPETVQWPWPVAGQSQ